MSPREPSNPAAEEFTSWSALTSMRPGQRPFRAPLSDCQRPQFSVFHERDHARAIRLAGKDWVLADPDDPPEPAPALPR